MGLSITISEDSPTIDADIVLLIKYDELTASAAHAFELAAELIRSMEDLDRVLTQSIDPQLTTALIVEDLEKSSLRIFLKNVLKGLPDDALRDGDVKKLVGHYLLKGKYAAIKWLDQTEDDPRKLNDLIDELAVLAKETDLRQLPDYPPPNPNRLAQPLDRFQEAKKRFTENESLTITLGEDQYSVHLDRNWLPSENIEPDDGEKELTSEQDQYLIIAKPDFIGNAKWSFRHGTRSVSYKISDDEWLFDFRSGRYPMKPGDALRVRIRVRHTYNKKGDLVESFEEIVKVFSVIAGEEKDDRLI